MSNEECGLTTGSSDYRWIIDPLDGTVNFAHQIPIFGISIALSFKGTAVLGVVLNPLSGELFSAVGGQGANSMAGRFKSPQLPASQKACWSAGLLILSRRLLIR